ncbi:MAG: hypothetical protein FWE26_01855 [Coriobacteriia bacterium]|nr:hypothetical protein [Coriobacteriia bacterium]
MENTPQPQQTPQSEPLPLEQTQSQQEQSQQLPPQRQQPQPQTSQPQPPQQPKSKKMRGLLISLIVLVVTIALAGGTYAGFLVHNHLEELAEQARLEALIARQEAAAQVFNSTHDIQKPWLMPVPEAEEITPATITFTFMGREHSVQPEANRRIYYGAKTADRVDLWERLWDELWEDIGWDYPSNGMDEMERLHEEKYYDLLTFDPQMDHAIESVLVQLRAIRDTYDLSNDEYIELLVKYVQSIPYCEIHGSLDMDERPVGCPRTPIQTLVDGTGDCDETAMLLAALLHRENFPISFLLFAPEQHVALGLRVEGDGYKGTGYTFIETTGLFYISEAPEMLGFPDEEIVLESDPIVLAIGTEIEDPMPYYSAEALTEVARIIDVRDRAEGAANNLRHWVERTPMSRAEFNRHVARHELCFIPLNRFHDVEPDPTGQINTDFMDRAQAIERINQNAWWE